MDAQAQPRRRLRTAEILAVGAELTVGETRDTNSGEIARSLSEAGAAISRINVLPDRLGVVAGVFRGALGRADLVVSTGGLGPTPDDLTREAIAAVLGETPVVDAELEAWLRGLWKRRRLPFPEINRKQAWLIPSSRPLANPNGTAPGWWIDRPDGRVVVLLPGPPREMRPMWFDLALPRLRELGLGRGLISRTLRLSGIGESQVADLLGEAILRRSNPEIATYARADAVDVRLSATAGRGRSAEALLDQAEALVLDRLGAYVWARGATTWPEAIGAELARLGWSLAIAESGTDGSLGNLLSGVAQLRRAESLTVTNGTEASLEVAARAIAERSGAEVGVALLARPRHDDTAVSVAIATPDGARRERHLAFLGGAAGRSRAALTGAAAILRTVRSVEARPRA